MVQLFVTLFENGAHFLLQLEKKRRRLKLNTKLQRNCLNDMKQIHQTEGLQDSNIFFKTIFKKRTLVCYELENNNV